MFIVAVVIQSIIVLLAPIVLGFWFNRRWGLSWSLFFGGALAFVSAWIITNLLPLPVEVSLILSAISQMGILYLIYRFQLKISTERQALMAGLGQGGIELILISIFVFLSLLQMLPLRDADDETLISMVAKREGIAEEEVAAEDVDDLREYIDDFWSLPWYAPVVQTAQALTTLPIQAALAIIVLGAWTHGNLRPLAGAMAMYFLSRILPIYARIFGGIPAWFAMSLLLVGIAIWFLNRLWPSLRSPADTRRATRRKA